jgi:hypothetical protein
MAMLRERRERRWRQLRTLNVCSMSLFTGLSSGFCVIDSWNRGSLPRYLKSCFIDHNTGSLAIWAHSLVNSRGDRRLVSLRILGSRDCRRNPVHHWIVKTVHTSLGPHLLLLHDGSLESLHVWKCLVDTWSHLGWLACGLLLTKSLTLTLTVSHHSRHSDLVLKLQHLVL